MNSKWKTLLRRDRQIIVGTTCCVIIFFAYIVLWMPLASSVQTLRHRVYANQHLLNWMQKSDKRIRAIEHSQQHITKYNAIHLLEMIQTDINKSPIKDNLSQLQKTDNDSIQLNFKKVDFDNLVKWINLLVQHQNLTITQATIIPETPSGIVDADLIFTPEA